MVQVVAAVQGQEEEHQQRIAQCRQRRHQPAGDGREYSCRNDQRDKEKPGKRIGRTAGKVEQSGNGKYVNRQLQQEFVVADVRAAANPAPGPQVDQAQRSADCQQRQQREAEVAEPVRGR